VHHGQPTEAAPEAARAEFREFDPAHEEILLPSDPAPAVPATGDESPVPGFEEIPAGFRRVLLLDADTTFRRALGQALAAHGLTVFAAADASAGLRLALEQRPWLLVVDARLPEAGAFEFFRAARGHSLLGKVPLVLLAGWDDYKARLHELGAGVADYVAKQSPLREILFRLQAVLRRHAPGAPQPGQVLAGDIEALGAPGALQMAHLARLSGRLQAAHGEQRVEVGFHQGEIVSARAGSLEGEAAVFAFIAWEHGSFAFVPGDAPQVARLGQGFEQLLLEGCRRLDEGRRPEEIEAHG
jgi:DNA-binding response OmpR family regulator